MTRRSKESSSAAGDASAPPRRGVEVPEGMWISCEKCKRMIYRGILEEELFVCNECDHHYRVDARRRIAQLNDAGTFEEMLPDLVSTDPLEFTDSVPYRERLAAVQKKSGEHEAIIVGKGFIKGRPLIMGAMNPNFIMGSMGAVVGEKVAAAAERAADEGLPLLMVTCSGGARMMEGMVSLVQMAKTSAAIRRLDQAGGLYIVVMADPTTAGVAASFAFLGDVIVAEPGALIGFAGPRVIANTIRATLPEGFQRAEFMLEHGFIDRIVHRRDLRSEIARLIDFCNK
ncbi:MAG: Acetyl-coenzyme A carboxylase carboxyl transferase subunit beta [Phycisphaerae bacterium]|nr:Acetyl-coenzyme A carboxylase carboxyl transferase subunit beta [Phycisphaerae bacterium]